MMKRYLLLTFMSACIVACQPEQTERTITGPIAENAMVSSAHPLATKVGVEVLKNGGNAIDAAVAVKFALAVVFPVAGNIGGGGFAVYRLGNGEIGSLDFREKAPGAATRDMYLDENGDVIPGLSTVGHLAAGVPGSVAGMVALHEKLGSMPFGELVQPAIDLASEGYTLTAYGALQLNRKAEVLAQVNGDDFFLLKDGGWNEGDLIQFKELATTLAKIRDQGHTGFYDGEVADLIVAEMKQGGGLITKEDLMTYEPKWRDPIEGSYRSHKVISMPPPSSGGVAVAQLLQGAEPYDIKAMGHNTIETVHLLTELERRVFADRATHLGDPDFYDVPVDMLLDPAYNTDRFQGIRLNEKTDSQDIKEGAVEVIESVETTHFSIVDKDRNAISITTTLNAFFGSQVYVEGAGFFLNNEMDDFSAKPGIPNMFGLVGAEANAVVAQKRMLSSMTPTIVEKGGELFMVVGSPGGATIITSVFQVIMNVIDHGMTMQQAVSKKRVHSQWLPDVVLMEKAALDSTVLEGLQSLGHKIIERDNWGKVDCVLVRDDGSLEGAADPRADDYAEGY